MRPPSVGEGMAARTRPRLMPPVYFFLAIAVMVVLDIFAPGARWVPRPDNLVGLVPIAGGLMLGGPAAASFRRLRTTIKPFEESSTLVTAGPFRLTRNPMYLSMALLLAGVAVYLRSVTPFVVIPVFAVWIQRRFIVHEEAMLADHFGDAYRDYRARVRRWL